MALLASSALFAGGACRHFCPPPTIQAWPTEPTPAQASTQAPPAHLDETAKEEVREPQPTLLEKADAALNTGNYRQAANVYRQILRASDEGPDIPHAMLRLSIIELLPSGSLHDEDAARARLRRLVSRYPNAPERTTAEALLSLGDQAAGLRQQLEELKRIDLGTPPSVSPH
jgi:tetratricopeptide (TPR) repeat protein